LEEYPDEPVAAHRWAKIAHAIGDRTPKQVASRVQKYFIKLVRQGKPLPGGGKPPTIPIKKKEREISKKFKNSKDNKSFKDDYYKVPPVSLSDESDEESDESLDVDEDLKETEEYRELLRLQKLKKRQQPNENERVIRVVHYNYKCNSCGIEPITGIRWKCKDCPVERDTNMCDDCVNHYESETHFKNHRLDKLEKVEETV